MSHFIHTLTELYDSSGIAADWVTQVGSGDYTATQAHTAPDTQPKTQRSSARRWRAPFLFRQMAADDRGADPDAGYLSSRWQW